MHHRLRREYILCQTMLEEKWNYFKTRRIFLLTAATVNMSNTLVQYLQALAFPYLVWHSSASHERGHQVSIWANGVRNRNLMTGPGFYHRSRTPVWSAGSRGSPGVGWCGPATWLSGPAGMWTSPDCNTPGPQSPPEDRGCSARLVNTQNSRPEDKRKWSISDIQLTT